MGGGGYDLQIVRLSCQKDTFFFSSNDVSHCSLGEAYNVSHRDKRGSEDSLFYVEDYYVHEIGECIW